MPTTTIDTTTSVRQGLARLLEWLTRHPAIPVAYLHYADDGNAELCLTAGGFDKLAAVADVADALTGATIEVNDPPGKRITWLNIAGTIPGDTRPGLAVLVEASVYDDARARLLASLGVPPNPAARSWPVTAQHLRGLLDAAAVRA